MKKKALGFGIIVGALALMMASSFAQDGEVSPGEVRIKTNVEYATVSVDGERSDGTEYDGSGKNITVKGLERNVDHVIVVDPGMDEYAPKEFTVKAGTYKKKRMKVDGERTLFYIVNKTLKFKKKK
jgi:hypothetical protein